MQRRYSWRSQNLDEIAKELYDLGIEVREEIRHLEVKGDNVRGKLYPTSAYLYRRGEFQTEKDKKLIKYVERRYKHELSREDILNLITLTLIFSTIAISYYSLLLNCR
jgi:hypothetical protein